MSYSVRADGNGTLYMSPTRGRPITREEAWAAVKECKARGCFRTIRVRKDGKQVWMSVNTGERWVDD